MNRFKLSTLSLALLGGLALSACDNTNDTAAVDAYEPDATATQPMDVEETAPVADVTDPTATGEFDTAEPTTTMGDVGEYDEAPMDEQEPTLAPETNPMEPETNELDPDEPVDETQPPQG